MIFLSFWDLNKRKISLEELGMPSHMEILFYPEIVAVSLQNLSQSEQHSLRVTNEQYSPNLPISSPMYPNLQRYLVLPSF